MRVTDAATFQWPASRRRYYPGTVRELPVVHILYANPAGVPPVEGALAAEGFRVEMHEIRERLADLARPPEEGIWLNRMSPSPHTRGHHDSVALMREVLGWLESADRRVINGSRAFEIELSKLRRYLLLRWHGIETPRTVLAVGRKRILEAARRFEGPFLRKHDQRGKGLGIQLFESADELGAHLDSGELERAPEDQVVLQEYIRAPEPFVTRVELAGGRFLFAMRRSIGSGFEPYLAESCRVEKRATPHGSPKAETVTFSPSPLQADNPLVRQYLALCEKEGIDIAGIEFVEDERGRRYTYDVIANTDHDQAFCKQVGVDGMGEIARWLRGVASSAPIAGPSPRAGSSRHGYS